MIAAESVERGTHVEPWRITREWEGEDVAILAGGPSLTAEDAQKVCASGMRVIAINSSYLLAPNADILYFCDARWWQWHKDRTEFKAFKGILVTLDNDYLSRLVPGLRVVRNVGQQGISTVPGEIKHGSNSGYQALHLALQLGARRALLLGYDMRVPPDGKTHWHGGHPVPTPKQAFSELMLPQYAGTREKFAALGLEVINCTPDSALTEYPYRSIDACLPSSPRRTALPL